MNLTIQIYGDAVIAQMGELVIKRSLTSIVKDWFAKPPPPPVYELNERELLFLLANLKESNNACPQRQVRFGIYYGGFGANVYVVDGDNHIPAGLCQGCNCL